MLVYILIREYYENYCNPHADPEACTQIVRVHADLEAAEKEMANLKLQHPGDNIRMLKKVVIGA